MAKRIHTVENGRHTSSFGCSVFWEYFALLVIGMSYLLKLMNQENPNWNLALSIGAFASFLWLFEYIGYATHFFNYNTSKSINIFLFEKYFGGILVSVFPLFSCIITTLMINLVGPITFQLSKKENRTYLQDAFVSMFCSLGLIHIILTINTLITKYHPTFIDSNAFKIQIQV